MKYSRTTKRIFDRSQRHEWFYYYAPARNIIQLGETSCFESRHRARLAAIKQVKQPKRIIQNQIFGDMK
jgi:hypothetical protein